MSDNPHSIHPIGSFLREFETNQRGQYEQSRRNLKKATEAVTLIQSTSQDLFTHPGAVPPLTTWKTVNVSRGSDNESRLLPLVVLFVGAFVLIATIVGGS